MKKILFIFFIISGFAIAQKKEISLEEIWSNSFKTNRINELNAMKGNYYSALEIDYKNRSTIVNKYHYETLQKVETIVNSSDLSNFSYFDSYQFNPQETHVLLSTETEPVYRRSSLSYYYVYDIANKKATKINEDKIQEPTFSPNGKKVAYVKNNNIYVKNIEENTTTQIAFDGKKNHIINGISDWVYEEEFSFVKALEWSTDSKQIAFLKFDETEVPSFFIKRYNNSLYPKKQTFKYPKAGEKNATVTLHIYRLNTKKTNKINLGDYEYIPRLKWTSKENIVSVQTLNRHQNNLNLFFVNTNTLQSNLVLNEKSKTYIDVHFNLTFLKDNSFIWTSEKDGWNHLYHYDNNGKLLQQITKGNWEITDFYGIDKKNNTLYYQSTQDGTINRSIHSVSLNGTNNKKLNSKLGTNKATFSKNFNYFIHSFSNTSTPPIYTLYNNKGKEIKEILNNKKLLKKLESYNLSKKEFFTIKTSEGEFNAWMIKPSNFNPNKKYPLLITQYSGPGSQSVKNSWNSYNDYWYQMLAQQGYVIVCTDVRGTGLKGKNFKTVTYLELGKYETKDLINVAKELSKETYINPSEIGIWGWSYGGFISANCLFKGSETFKMAISVAPVTNWRFYDTIYTERYMRTPQENPNGYDDNSPVNHAQKLSNGKLLLIHGTADDNVHIQNTMALSNALIKENKTFEQMIYADRTHGVYEGKNTRLHLFNKMTLFIKKNLIPKNK